MLNFRNTNIVFVLLLLFMLSAKKLLTIPNYSFIVVALVYVALITYGSYFIQSRFFIKTICKAKTNEKKIALSFDDGPAENYTPKILSILTKYQVPAAFFCIGNRIKGNEALVKQIDIHGHIIGNHSYSHHYLFDVFSSNKMLADIRRMDSELIRAGCKKPRFFRPPFGVTTPGMNRVLKEGNYTSIGWNIRSYDTMFRSEEKLYERVISRIKPGAIILFHDTAEITMRILPAVIEYAQQNGYIFERLDKLIDKQAYA